MKTEIIVAIIGAIAVILGAIIAGIFSIMANRKKKQSNGNIDIKQKQNGNNNIQIGVQNNYGRDADK